MDENADGEISEEEFYNALTQVVGELDAAEKNRLYTLVDSDGSETISYDEYLYIKEEGNATSFSFLPFNIPLTRR